ncbi:MATE family efflux transporter [Vaginisenegalia massiliensis]|uniref:MATE family efflux transporter n=1 Tax=Vaginisenegalia massiliensis TaxID=2058294 RepID=UPI0013DDDE9F|nr:MATE family efflux transporter [Vaginisenegalia massiliensis]
MSLIKDPISRQVMHIAWPILVEVTFASLFGMINLIMVGKYEGGSFPSAAYVAAIGMINIPFFFILAFVQSVGVGGTTLLARAFGAQELDRLDPILKHVVLMGLVLVVPLIVFVLSFQLPIMRFLGAQNDAIQASMIYYRLVMVGLFFISLTSMVSAAIRGVGETKAPMRFNLLANGLNIIIGFCLIRGRFFFPELGIVGAGIATLVANIIACGLMFWYVASGKSVIQVNWFKPFKFRLSLAKQILAIGLPSAGEQMILRTGLLLYTQIVASMGTVIMAAHQIALNILSFSFTPGMALGIAASALVGQSLGAGKADMADKFGRRSSFFALLIGLMMGAFFYLLRHEIGYWYNSDPAVIRAVSIPLSLMAITAPFQLPQLTEAGALRGAGDTIFPMISTGFSVIAVRVALSYLFVYYLGWGLWGAWLAVFCDQVVRSMMITIRYQRGKWKTIEIKPD